jgi:hypothetical protein
MQFPRFGVLLLAILLISCASRSYAQAVDTDHDGLSDEFEQAILDQFQPRWMISATDCAGVPASFQGGAASPQVAAKDGTIYGQVFPVSPKRVEAHYYTLWDRDCGRVSHALDVEHVAVLVSLEGPEPQALYWYAGAHEKTLCDISSAARASAVYAVDRGPQVWSSSGKHAIYFSEAKCDSGSGCGADSCADNTELARTGKVINVGELNHPAEGADWVASSTWVLREKMTTNFTPEVLAVMNAAPPDQAITVKGRSTYRGTIQVSDTVLGSTMRGAEHTSAALATADTHTSSSLQKASNATGRSLKRAWKAVFGSKPKTSQ